MLENKVIIVTGGNGLLGKKIIEKLSYYGATPINVDINFLNNPGEYEYYCDISNELSVDQLISDIFKKYNKIDGWINNAYPRTDDWNTDFEEVSFNSWKKNIDMHLNGYFLCSQKILKKMKIQNEGSLINMASIYGIVGPDFSLYEDLDNMTMPAAYSAIKGGIINLTRYLASYYGKYNIRINSVSPGGIYDNQADSFIKKYNLKTPLNRMARPEDVTPIVCFLLSNDSKYITGQNILVDGGYTIT